MKIVIVTDIVDEQSAGGYVYAENLIKNLLEVDKVNTYYFIHKRANPLFRGLEEIIIPQKRLPFYRFYRFLVLLPRAINDLGADIVHHIGHFPVWTLPWTKIKALKIVTIFDLTPITLPHTHRFHSWLLHRLFMARIIRSSNQIITISAASKRDILKQYSPSVPISVTYLASRFSEHDLAAEMGANFKKLNSHVMPYILHVGTIEPRKNLPFLISVFNKFKKEFNPSLKLVLIGKNGWKNKNFFTAKKASPFSDDILWIENVENVLLPYWYKNATLCVYPSLSEGFGLPPLEALSLGCPVVASDVSSLPEVVGEGGVLCPVNNLTEWVQALATIIKDKGYRQELIERGHKKAQQFSWTKCAQETVAIYQTVRKLDPGTTRSLASGPELEARLLKYEFSNGLMANNDDTTHL